MFTPKNYRYMFRNDLEAFPHYRHTPNLQTKKRTNASFFTAKRCICPCMFHMFILVKPYRAISLFS